VTLNFSNVLQITRNNLEFTIHWQKEFKEKIDLKFCKLVINPEYERRYFYYLQFMIKIIGCD